MRYSGIQPQYFPRLHYFARILATDIFMIRDEVQFVIKHKYPNGEVDKSYQAHSPIKHSWGRHLLAVPTKKEGYKPISETAVSYNTDWINNHLNALKFAYSRSQNFAKIHSQVEKLLNGNYQTIAELNIRTIIWGILNLLGEQDITNSKLSLDYLNNKLRTQKLFRLKEVRLGSQSETVKGAANLSPNEKIILLCQEVGATEDYCGATGVAAYVDHKLFDEKGIKITIQDWQCPEYPQRFSKLGYIPNLSIIDLLMNLPQRDALKILYQ